MKSKRRRAAGQRKTAGLAKRMAAAVLTGAFCAGIWVFPVWADNDTIESLREQIDQAEDLKKATEDAKDATEDNIDNLGEARTSLQGQLDGLTQDLTAISQNLEEIESDIIDKNEEIRQAQEELEEAKATEEAQYEAMKKRLRYLYEDHNQTYFEILANSRGFSDLLTQRLYIEKLHEYDRNMLARYKAQREAVEELEARLEQEKADLDELQAAAVVEKGKITDSVNSTKSGIAGYSDQIAAAQQHADALAEQISQQEEDIAALKKQLEEEIAKSRLARQSSWRDISEVTFTEDDRYLLANLIYCEAGNQPYEGQVAVGAVVINRVLSSVYPNTVSGVIYQYKQFAPVLDGHLALALAENRATESCYRAADEAMSGYTNVGQCVYFRTPIPGLSGIQIGDHIFY